VGTIHSLADARRKRRLPDHEIKALEETGAIVNQYFQQYLASAKELAELRAALDARKELVKSWKGWFIGWFKGPTTNMLQHAVDTAKYRTNWRHSEFKRAKEVFDREKERLEKRMNDMQIYRTDK